MPQVKVPDSPSLVVTSWISSFKAGASPTVSQENTMKIIIYFYTCSWLNKVSCLTTQPCLDAHGCAPWSAESGLIFSKDSELVLRGFH